MDVPISDIANLINLLLTAVNAVIAAIGVTYTIASGFTEKKKSEETRVEQDNTYEDGITNIPDKRSHEEKEMPQHTTKT